MHALDKNELYSHEGPDSIPSNVEDPHFFRDGSEDFEGLIDLGTSVFAGHDGANAGFTFGHGREGDSCGHDAGVKEGAGEVHGFAAVTDDDGGDGRFTPGRGAAAYVEAGVGELLFEVVGTVPEALDAVGLVFEDVEGGDAGGCD